MAKLFLIDAYALIFRSYYAFLGRSMHNGAGVNTAPIFGFTKFLRDIISRERPGYLGVAFDPKGGNFRHELYPLYKANRTATPEDITAAIPYIKRILEAMRIPTLEVAGYEADDVIGTLSVRAAAEGFDVFMVTPDKDYGQLVTEHSVIYKQSKGEGVEIVDKAGIKAHYGFDDPRLVIDVLALWGDASDNVPGVPGIGEKGAIKLINTYGCVERIIEAADSLPPKQRENILSTREQLMLSKRLVTIDTAVPIDFDAEDFKMEDPDCAALKRIYAELGFNMFLREMETNASSPFNAAVVCNVETAADEAPRQAAQTQLATMAIEKSYRKREAALKGQGSLFDMPESAVRPVAGVAAPSEPAEPDMLTVGTVEHEYIVASTAEQAARAVEEIGAFGEFCFDTETTGLDVFRDRIVGLSLAAQPHRAYYMPFTDDNREALLAVLRPLFEDESKAKIGQNVKFDINVLRRCGIEVRGRLYDTMILHYLLDPESRHGMNYLSRRYLNYAPVEIETLIGTGPKKLTMDMVPVDKVAEYAAEDADVTLQLKAVLWELIEQQDMRSLYFDIEEPMIRTLADMELTGVKIDSELLNEYAVELGVQLKDMEARVREMAGEPNLNVNSSRQLGEVLFAKLLIDGKPRMTKTKQFRTDEEYLQMLAPRHPIIPLILEYRGVKKLLSTYVEALPQLVNPETGRIHTSFNQAVTATGRLSSTNPNLQNIPIRDAMGRRIRQAFIPSGPDRLIFSADYSQVELRLMAHLCGDEHLIEAFRSGEDIHRATAARLFGITPAQVTDEQRRRAKTANFGIIYGISAFGLAQRLGLPRGEAKEIIEGYFRSYPRVKEYMEEVAVHAREKGYVTTIFGRRRYLSDINSRNAVARALAERNAINAPIQGSAADIMKLAMTRVHERFEQLGLKSRMILQVHDEIVVDMLKSEEAQVREIVVQAMQGAANLSVELVAECGMGENWLAAH